jgi:hypothetical protein
MIVGAMGSDLTIPVSAIAFNDVPISSLWI